jgi:hypothetical protein
MNAIMYAVSNAFARNGERGEELKKIVSLAVEYGADINAVSPSGKFALRNALNAGNAGMASHLLSEGADPTQLYGPEKNTLISRAMYLGNLEMFEILLSGMMGDIPGLWQVSQIKGIMELGDGMATENYEKMKKAAGKWLEEKGVGSVEVSPRPSVA